MHDGRGHLGRRGEGLRDSGRTQFSNIRKPLRENREATVIFGARFGGQTFPPLSFLNIRVMLVNSGSVFSQPISNVVEIL